LYVYIWFKDRQGFFNLTMGRRPGSKNKAKVQENLNVMNVGEGSATVDASSSRMIWHTDLVSELLHLRMEQFESKFSGSKSNSQRNVAWQKVAILLNLKFFDGQKTLNEVQVKNKYTALKMEYNSIKANFQQTGNNVEDQIALPEYWDELNCYFGQLSGMASNSFQDCSILTSNDSEDDNLFDRDLPNINHDYDNASNDDTPIDRRKRKREVDESISQQRQNRNQESTKKTAIENGLSTLGKSLEIGMLSFASAVSSKNDDSATKTLIMEVKESLEKNFEEQRRFNEKNLEEQRRFNEKIFEWIQKQSNK
jgi:hypothetical protein